MNEDLSGTSLEFPSGDTGGAKPDLYCVAAYQCSYGCFLAPTCAVCYTACAQACNTSTANNCGGLCNSGSTYTS